MNFTASSAKRTTATLAAGLTVAGAAAVGISAPAQAASVATWDRLAQCESGGNWAINTGNGFYGGVQFTLTSWRAVGGQGYPHQASKAEQIDRAEKLLAIQGWGAWPSCSKQLGLTAADAAGSSATPIERTSSVDHAAQQRAAAEKAAAEKAAAEKAAAQRAEAQRQAEAERQAAAERWAAKVAAQKAAAERAEAQRQAAAEAAAEKAATERAEAQRQAAAEAAAEKAAAERAATDRAEAARQAASERSAAARQAASERSAAAQRAAAERAEARRQAAQQDTVVVVAGDTLFSLANKHRIDGGWEALYQANTDIIEDPNLIYVGQELTLPRG